MKRQPFCNFTLAGVSLTDYGLKIPSPFTSLNLTNSEITSMTAWTLNVVVGGDSGEKVNIAAFEALLYSAAQAASRYPESTGIPVSFVYGWLDDDGNVDEYSSYQGWTLTYKTSTTGLYMSYEVTGYASLAVQSSMPVLRIPEVCGIVQPSAVLEGLAKAIKADLYYELDIDHCDSPTLVNHGALTTSFNKYVRGDYSGEDDYKNFPGLLSLSKSYSASRTAAGLISGKGVKKLSQVMNHATVTPIDDFLKQSNVDTTPQCASFSYWVEEPTMTKPGVIHYKSNAGLMTSLSDEVLEYGTANTNIISIDGSYNGVAYNMTNMNFTELGFTIDGSGNTITQDAQVVNSWSSTLADVFQSANIINDVNALATQFSGTFTIKIPGSVKNYTLAQPISLIVMAGNTLSPISGIYNIIEVDHDISNSFITTLKVQRLVMSSANEVATIQGIYVSGSGEYPSSTFTTTSNIISPYKVDFGNIYPDFTYMAVSL